MHWSQTESSKWSLDCLYRTTRAGPLMVDHVASVLSTYILYSQTRPSPRLVPLHMGHRGAEELDSNCAAHAAHIHLCKQGRTACVFGPDRQMLHSCASAMPSRRAAISDLRHVSRASSSARCALECNSSKRRFDAGRTTQLGSAPSCPNTLSKRPLRRRAPSIDSGAEVAPITSTDGEGPINPATTSALRGPQPPRPSTKVHSCDARRGLAKPASHAVLPSSVVDRCSKLSMNTIAGLAERAW